MSTPRSLPRNPRLPIKRGTLLTALGVLIAIATTITFIALTATHHTTATTPPAATHAAASPTPHNHYLGPQQQNARPKPQTTQPHYTCLGAAHHCLP